MIAFVSLGRFLCSVKSFGPDGSVFYFYLLVSCLPLHTTRDGVQKYGEQYEMDSSEVEDEDEETFLELVSRPHSLREEEA